MKHYTDTISPDLAGKLKEKGMPKDCGCNLCCYPPYDVEEEYTFGFVFDWLMERGLFVVVEPHWDFADEVITKNFDAAVIRQGTIHTPTPFTEGHTWHEAADKAIEKALELMK